LIPSENRPHALVTGGANGLGRAFVDQLAREGYEIHIIDNDEAGLQALHHDAIGEIVTHKINLAETGELENLIQSLAKRGLFEIVILNAGISAVGRFERIPASAHEKVLAINLDAPMLIANGLASRSAMTVGASMVFISSLSVATGYPGATSYAAAKQALAVYAASVTKPFAKLGIRVTCAFPGPIRTAHAERYAPPGASAERRMAPERAAELILKSAKAGKRTCYPGLTAKLAAMAGRIAPAFLTAKMRQVIFEKLDREVY